MRVKLLQPIETQVLRVDPDRPASAAVRLAAATLARGGLVAFPTETVYGLGADATIEAAVLRIFAAKQRPSSDPLIVHIADPHQMDAVATDIPELARRLAARFWPGPLTLVLRRAEAIPAAVSAGRATVAVRMPRHRVALELIRQARAPIAAPSANLFSRPSPTTAAHVLEDLRGRIDLVLDGGPTTVGLESTVLDLTVEPPAVLRPGGVSLEELRTLSAAIRYSPRHLKLDDSGAAPSAPGQLLKHYSPRGQVQLYAGPREAALARMRADAGRLACEKGRVGVLVIDEDRESFDGLPVAIVAIGSSQDPPAVARNLFAALREMDLADVAVILVRPPSREGLGEAIWDRLYRAAEGNVVEC